MLKKGDIMENKNELPSRVDEGGDLSGQTGA